MTRALITGLSGQDGGYLAERLLDAGYEVCGLIRNETEATALPETIRDRVTLVVADVTEAESVAVAISEARAHEVYHLAATTFVPSAEDNPAGTLTINGMGTLNVLQPLVAQPQSARARVFVATSAAIFGAPVASPQDEQTPVAPIEPYGVSKVLAHHLVRMYRERYGLYAVSGILFNHESRRRPPSFVMRKITRAAARISRGLDQHVELGSLEARRDWSHARDIVAGMHLSLQAVEPADYVLGSGTTHTVRDIVEIAFAEVGLDWRDHVRGDASLVRPEQGAELRADAGRAHDVLGWQTRVSFEDLVRDLVAGDLEALDSETAV